MPDDDLAALLQQIGKRAALQAIQPSFHEQQMFADQHGFVPLVQNRARLHYDALLQTFRVVTLLFDCHGHPDGVSDENRFYETEPVIPVGHSVWVDFARGHSHSNAEDQRPVSQALPERLCFAPFCIHVMRIEITGLSGMDYDIGFRDRAPARLALLARNVVFEITLLKHPRFLTEHYIC